MKNKPNGYELSRKWFDFCFENSHKVKPIHTAMYCFIIEHFNRHGWKRQLGLPTTVTMEALGIGSYNTYKKTLNDLIEFNFIEMVQKSKNQYTSNIIALLKNDEALDRALDDALIKQVTKQEQSTGQSIDSIIKQINNKQLNKKTIKQLKDAIASYEKEDSGEKVNYTDFLNKFNDLTGKKIRTANDKFKRQYKKLLKNFTQEEILIAVKNCKNDDYHIQNPKYLTPEFITRQDKFEKYFNAEQVSPKNTKVDVKEVSNQNYSQGAW